MKRLLIGAVLAAAPINALLVEPRRLQITKNAVRLDNLPASLDGFRIVHLSDVHLSLSTPDRFIRGAVDAANELEPDVAVVTGDFISRNAANARPCARELARLKAPEGVFAVLGNHDHWVDAPRMVHALEDVGITVLTNRHVQIGALWVAGIDDIWAGHYDLQAALKGVPEDAPLIVLSHSPLALPRLEKRECLILSGHTHGGHVNIPFLAEYMVRLVRGGHYIAGWYEKGRARMYVNRGLGGTPIRFRARPEVAVFVLISGVEGESR